MGSVWVEVQASAVSKSRLDDSDMGHVAWAEHNRWSGLPCTLLGVTMGQVNAGFLGQFTPYQ